MRAFIEGPMAPESFSQLAKEMNAAIIGAVHALLLAAALFVTASNVPW